MIKRTARVQCSAGWLAVLWLGGCLLCTVNALGGDAVPTPNMPSHWKVISDFQAPVEQVKTLSGKLGAQLSGVRNTVYDVNGKRVQLNVIVASDSRNADKLMAKLRTLKAEAALLRKQRIVYEFVGQNDVLPLITEGRQHLDAM